MAITLNGTTGITTPALDSVAPFSSADMPAGSVLQVVQGTTTSATSTTSSTYQATGISASITPTSATSKILVIIQTTISGKNSFSAGDIEDHTSHFKIMNPSLLICSMEPTVNLELEITITKGRGYVPADESITKDSPIGVIPVDAIYTPIKNVSYKIESTRVGQRTDYEKLTIDLKTDGTIHPEEAIKEASRIMIQHLMLITDENITFDDASSKEENIVDEHILHMRKLLKTSLEDLDLSVRAYNCLKAAKINTLAELVHYDTHELLKFRNFGKKSLVEIEELLVEKGLNFGMDLAKFKLDEE